VTGAPGGLAVIGADQVRDTLAGAEAEVVDLVERTYAGHARGDAVNPHSHFLRFPDRPADRIIALPGYLADPPTAGIKWISSVPGNVDAGLPRASAVLVLNDPVTGFPFAVLEASLISAARTAASAALGAARLSRARGVRPVRLGVVGCGRIAETVRRYLPVVGIVPESVLVHDLVAERAAGWAANAAAGGATVEVAGSAEQVARESDLLLLATVAAEPYLTDASVLDAAPLVLNVSLRDLDPALILRSWNVVDDLDHCLTAGTSPHLAEGVVGHRRFVAGTIADVLAERIGVPRDEPVVFSPFGLGVLDLAVARMVHDRVRDRDALVEVAGFFDGALTAHPLPAGAR
jgi:ornithine cyclodeaminase